MKRKSLKVKMSFNIHIKKFQPRRNNYFICVNISAKIYSVFIWRYEKLFLWINENMEYYYKIKNKYGAESKIVY